MLRLSWAGLLALLASALLQLGCERKADEQGEPIAQVQLALAGAGGASGTGGDNAGDGGDNGGDDDPPPNPLPPRACDVDEDCGTRCQRCEAGQCVANLGGNGQPCGYCIDGGVCQNGHCVGGTRLEANVECRPAASDCDAAETCPATTDSDYRCPADKKLPEGTFCGEMPTLPCDARDTCDGAGQCIDRVREPEHQCRPKDPDNDCDVADFCDGQNKECPDDQFAPEDTICGGPPQGPCDAQDTCDANGKCVDLVHDNTQLCNPRDPTNDCDVDDYCDGTNKECPAAFAAPGTLCEDGNLCTGISGQPDACNADGECIGGGAVVCTNTNPCRTGGTCDPATGQCSFGFQPPETPCDDGIACTVGDECDGNGTCQPGAPMDSDCPRTDCAAGVCDPVVGCRLNPGATTGNLCRPAAGPCDVDETCDGVNPDCPPDVLLPADTQCQAPSCSAGIQVNEGLCTGADPLCTPPPNIQCSPYACNGLVCGATCDDDDGCLPDFYCDRTTNTCEPRIGAGQPCTDDGQCTASNPHCVDGVCCNSTCNGQCEACNLTGNLGTCSPVTGDPVGERPACNSDGTLCAGTCGGTLRTACVYPATGVECAPASCDAPSNQATPASTCSGSGQCLTPATVGCQPYTCGPTSCRGDCTADAHCVDGSYCNGGVCEPQLGAGSACTQSVQCSSGHCVDGVCCNTACTSQCEACNLPGQAGACLPVSGAPVGNRTACAGDDVCGGVCDGVNRFACSYPGAGTECRAASCSGATATLAASCDGAGSCPAAQTVDCPDGCDGSLCAGAACTVNADCSAGEVCRAGICAPAGELGAACSSGAECASGYCIDGVCCDGACTGQCEACNVAGSLGTCSPVPAGDAPRGARPACTSDGSVCAGYCDGSTRSACAYPDGDVCRAGSCNADGVATVEARCQGEGVCPVERQQDCGAAGCDATSEQCDGPCASDPSACAATEFCSAGLCVPKRTDGQSCSADAECTNGHCVDGVCCNEACTDQCAACNVPGSIGSCSPAVGPARGGRAGCAGTGACGAQCDGTSTAACQFPGTATTCGEASCGNGAAFAAPSCDGAGSCQPPTATRCDTLRCNGTECAASCTTDADCLGDTVCDDGACVTPPDPEEPEPEEPGTEDDLIAGQDEGSCGCKLVGNSRPGSPLAPLAPLTALFFLMRRRASRSFQARGLQ